MDNIGLTILIVSAVFLAIIIYFFVISIIQLAKGECEFRGNGIKGLAGFVLSLIFMAGLAYCLYHIPDVLLGGHSWYYISLAGPSSVIIAAISISVVIVAFYLYFLFNQFFVNKHRVPYFAIGVLSAFSGLGNGLILYVVNQVFSRGNDIVWELLYYFIMGGVIYIVGQRIVRSKLINITNDFVFKKRIEIIEKVLKTNYHKLEEIGFERIQTCLNNDTETVSNLINIIITAITAFITLVCCFVYMAFISFSGFIASLLVVAVSAGVYFITSIQANKFWERTRDIQNLFFKFMHDMINGFKELNINSHKRHEFKEDMYSSCNEYREKRIKGDILFANVFVVGEFLFSIVIAAVIFIFPLIFGDIRDSTMTNFVFLFIYITGPVRVILSTIPGIINVRVCWNRIKLLLRDVALLEEGSYFAADNSETDRRPVNIQVRGLKYKYKTDNSEEFVLGPIDFNIKSGEILFITGGNGSGKTTLIKLLTGLYIPDEGEILINDCKILGNELCQYFSAIFGDFHLFSKLYGINVASKKKDIEKYLKILQLEEKVQVIGREFSTIKLSAGQKKRLAMLVSYLEDRKVYLFDEWAAEQDPEYRKYFYDTLLPQLKAMGKCVIAITHDDRYFNTADKLLKLERGIVTKFSVNDVLTESLLVNQ